MIVRNKSDRPRIITPAGTTARFTVDARSTVEVPDDLGRSLIRQSDRWEAVGDAADGGEEDDDR